MSRILSALIMLLTACTSAIGQSRIKYDSSCITIDGKDTFIYSGAFHYFRCPKELWRDRLAKMKEAGLNCVETYVAWNWHEPTPPADLNDKSKFVRLDELDEFLRLAEDEFGMYTIVRPGPYICAEWECGGFPTWLSNLKPKDYKGTWFRSDEPTFIAWSKHYLTQIAKVVKPHLITNRPVGKPGVILWQIENEYDFGPQPMPVKYNLLRALYQASRDDGIDIPIFTCIGGGRTFFRDDPVLRENVIETVNSYPSFNARGLIDNIVSLQKAQPEKFKMVTELQGGWFAQTGGQLSENQGHNAAQINHISVIGIEYGLTSMNYYMFFGGTNFGGWGADNQVSSYDYNAPIREHGGVGDRWLACKAIGAFLAEHGSQLTRAQSEEITLADKLPDNVSVTMRKSQDGSRFVFIRNTARQNAQKGSATIAIKDQPALKFDYELGQFGAKILYIAPDGKQDWYPKEQSMPPEPAQADLPQPIELKSIRTQSDPGPKDWISIKPDQTLEQAGVLDNRMVFYRGKLSLPETNANFNAIVKTGSHDSITMLVNGKLIPAKPSGEGLFLDTGKTFKPGINDFQLIYNNAGHPNGGTGMEIQKGVRSILLSRSDIPDGASLKSWRFKVVDFAAAKSAVAVDFDDSSWTKTELTDRGQLNDNGIAVFRTTFDYNEDMQKNGLDQLTIGSIDEEGDVYLNGEKIGESRDWAKRTNVSMTGKLKIGTNTLAIIVRNQQGMGGMSRGASIRATLSGTNAVTELSIGFPQGEELGFANADFDDANWVTQNDIKTRSAGLGLLSWVRMPFDLAKPKAGVWAPYKLHLEAQGEGYVYLNGHNLGRYWQVGPQRDFYLPECWLNFDGKKNVISLSFRALDKPVGVDKAVISVYSDFAEKR